MLRVPLDRKETAGGDLFQNFLNFRVAYRQLALLRHRCRSFSGAFALGRGLDAGRLVVAVEARRKINLGHIFIKVEIICCELCIDGFVRIHCSGQPLLDRLFLCKKRTHSQYRTDARQAHRPSTVMRLSFLPGHRAGFEHAGRSLGGMLHLEKQTRQSLRSACSGLCQVRED
jgi:hypothetical protein